MFTTAMKISLRLSAASSVIAPVMPKSTTAIDVSRKDEQVAGVGVRVKEMEVENLPEREIRAGPGYRRAVETGFFDPIQV